MDVQDLTGKRGGRLADVGGISVNHAGAPGALLARALIQEPAVGYSSVVEFSDPQTAKSSRLDGAGLRIGKIAGEQLTQVAVARNVGDSPAVVTGRIPYTTSAGNAGELSLPQVRLASGEVKEVKLSEAIEEGGLKKIAAAGLQFEYSSKPGTIVMSALSVSSSGNQVFRVPLVNAKAQESSTGRYPWMIEGSASTFVYIKNASDHPQRYQLQVDYEGGAYALGIKTVAAGQTVVFDIRKLRDNQTPDEGGHAIPLNATHGQVSWSVDGREDLTLIGRAEQVDVASGLSMTSACQTCCQAGFYDGWCDPGSATGLPGDTGQFTAKQRKQDCHGNILSAITALSPTWSSTNTSVATVNSSGFATAQAAGTTNIVATWDVTYIDFQANGCNWDPDNCTNGVCYHRETTFTANAICDVAFLRAKVVNPPIANDGDTAIAGQQFTFQVEAINPAGNRATSINVFAAANISGGLAAGESFPDSITISNGVGSSSATLKVVAQTGAIGRNYAVTASNAFSSSTATGTIKIWFDVLASREGLVGATTACNHTIGANDHFVALPSTGLCDTNIMLVNGNTSANTSVLDVGPWFPHASPTSGNPCVGGNDQYWTTTGVPRAESSPCSNGAGIDLADGTFADLGLTGNGRIKWRFR
jgi:hypothetical protein